MTNKMVSTRAVHHVVKERVLYKSRENQWKQVTGRKERRKKMVVKERSPGLATWGKKTEVVSRF